MADWLQAHGVSPELQGKLLLTAITIGVLWAGRRIVLGLAYRGVTDPWGRYRWRKAVSYVTLAVGIILVGRTWFVGMQTLATFFGLLSAGLAIALKDPVADLAAWAFIVWARPFEVGDRIQIGAHAGDVIDLRLFQFTLNEIGNWVDADQSTGRIIHINNGRVFTEPLANYDKGFKYIWNEVPVLITFESDWKKAKEILTRIAFTHAEHLTGQAEADLLAASRQYLINYRKLTPIVYTKVVDSGVQLTMRYLIEPRKRRGTEHAIWEEILTEFAACPDVDLAYHTVRSFKITEEGKTAHPPKPTRRGAAQAKDRDPLITME
jgi:small-conductance mechanosensitive channel